MIPRCCNTENSFKYFTDIFDDFFTETYTGRPTADVIENDNEFVVEVMLPGFKKEDISVDVKDDALIIEGERVVDDKIKYNRKGSFFGTIKAAYELPEYVDGDNVDASFTDGVLSITIPKDVNKKLRKQITIS